MNPHFVNLQLHGALAPAVMVRAQHVVAVTQHMANPNACTVELSCMPPDHFYTVAAPARMILEEVNRILDIETGREQRVVARDAVRPAKPVDPRDEWPPIEARSAPPEPSLHDQYSRIEEATRLPGDAVWVSRIALKNLFDEADMLRQYHDADQTVGRHARDGVHSKIDQAEYNHALEAKRGAEQRIIEFRCT